MKKTLILVAGYPGTGKSYLANLIVSKFSGISLLSPDKIKEKNWDLYGFNNLDEKELINKKSWSDYFLNMQRAFQKNASLISDYPFSLKQKEKITNLTSQYNYQVITIRLTGNLDVLFERQKIRDLDETRHLGHILTSFHKGEKTLNHENANNLLGYEEFMKRCKTRGYEKFSLGTLYEIDVTDFGKVNYDQLLMEIEKKMIG